MSPDGSTVFVTGDSLDGLGYYDYATVAYDAATGAHLWVARHDGPGGGNDFATAIAVSPDGATVYVTGRDSHPFGFEDYATIAYDAATGHQRWIARYSGPGNGNDDAYAMAVSQDGSTVFVTGDSVGSGGDYDYATLAYDAATGAQRWVARYDSPVGFSDFGHALALSPDGATVFVTGTGVDAQGDTEYATVAYDAATGVQHWEASYDGPVGGDGAFLVAVSPDGGSVFVSGESVGSGTSNDYATLAYDAASGEQRWVARYDGPAHSEDLAEGLGVSPDGGSVFVTGSSYGVGSPQDYATVAYDAATGEQKWEARYDGPVNGADLATALATSPDGLVVFVTGYSEGQTQFDLATIGYNSATGHQRGIARVGPGSATALAVSPDGTELIVTGSAQGYGTVAYDLTP